jgi:splicing factor 45
VNAQKTRPKFVISKPPTSSTTQSSSSPGKDATSTSAQPAVKTSLADWADQDDGLYFGEQQRERGGRKARKKKKNKEPVAQDWDDLYDPTRPNNYEEYMQSEERIREIRDWKERLYAHRITKRPSSDLSSDDDDRPRRTMNGKAIFLKMGYNKDTDKLSKICTTSFLQFRPSKFRTAQRWCASSSSSNLEC